ncbi:MAG: hypothetical protein ACR2OA_01405 [Rubripirellula sp.]
MQLHDAQLVSIEACSDQKQAIVLSLRLIHAVKFVLPPIKRFRILLAKIAP